MVESHSEVVVEVAALRTDCMEEVANIYWLYRLLGSRLLYECPFIGVFLRRLFGLLLVGNDDHSPTPLRLVHALVSV